MRHSLVEDNGAVFIVNGESTMPNPKYAAYEAAYPYFELVRGALGDLVDGEHFFDIVAEDVVYEVLSRMSPLRIAAFRYCLSKIALRTFQN